MTCDRCEQDFNKDELAKKSYWSEDGHKRYDIEYFCEDCE